MSTETLSLRKKKLADTASKLLKEHRLSRKQKAQCKEIIRDYEKHRSKMVIRELKP
jgi:hypothetical protein